MGTIIVIAILRRLNEMILNTCQLTALLDSVSPWNSVTMALIIDHNVSVPLTLQTEGSTVLPLEQGVQGSHILSKIYKISALLFISVGHYTTTFHCNACINLKISLNSPK
jgi:hypothetical protein